MNISDQSKKLTKTLNRFVGCLECCDDHDEKGDADGDEGRHEGGGGVDRCATK